MAVCGSEDPRLAENGRALEKRYREEGGQITLVVNEGQGHYPLAPRDAKPMVEFIVGKAH